MAQSLDQGPGSTCSGKYRGALTGLPLIPCPSCKVARMDELRVRQDNDKNYSLPYFKCPNKECGHYKMQRPYFDILVAKKLIVLQFDALEDEDEVKSKDAAAGEALIEAKYAAAGGALIEAKLDKLSNTMQRVLVLVVALAGIALLRLFN